MNLSCIICAEVFSATDEVHVTPCGHLFHQTCLLQWLERSKTCPQCRNKCPQRSVHKIYFNIANLDTSSIDIGSLQQQLEDQKLQYQIKVKEEEKLKKEIDDLKTTRRKCMETITALEAKVESNKFALTHFAEQVKILKTDTKVVVAQRNEIAELKRQIELMESIQTVISATASEVEKFLEQEKKPETLATWVVVLRKELKASESKRSDLRNVLKTVQHDLRKSQEIKRNLESKISSLESENYALSTKVEQFEKKNQEVSEKNNKNLNLSDHCICGKRISGGSTSTESGIIDLEENFSPGIPQKVKQIESSDSPYLNVKSSNLGLNPILKFGDLVKSNRNANDVKTSTAVKNPNTIFETHSNLGILRKTQSEDLSNKYSIFKKPRLAEQPIKRKMNPALAFNGLGGSEKILTSPTKLPLFDEELKSKSSNNINNRLKAGKLKNTNLGLEKNSLDKFINRKHK